MRGFRRTTRAAKRIAAVVAVSCLALPAAGGIAQADPVSSGRVPVPTGMPLVFPTYDEEGDLVLPEACSFPVRLDEVANKEYSKTLPGDRTLITGRLVVRFTNLDTGASVVRNISGPFLMSTVDGVQTNYLTGRSGSIVFGPTGARLYVFSGPNTLINNGAELTSYSGRFEDLCATLGGGEPIDPLVFSRTPAP